MSHLWRVLTDRLSHLWREVRRRRVLHAVGLYLAGSWLILQVLDVVGIVIGPPELVMSLSISLVVFGLPLIAVLSWRYDVTLDGIKRTPSTIEPEGADLSLKRIDYLVILLGALSVIGVSITLARALSSDTPPAVVRTAQPNSIAVMPFKYIGELAEDSYLAQGLAEDILHRLTMIESLKIASRTSSFELETHGLDISQIGQRLGVRFLLEGSVRRDGKRLRIVAQLIDTESGYQNWSGKYDRMMADLFDIYDEISSAVAGELKLTVSPGFTRSAPPTSDIEAYDYFLQARSMLLSDRQSYEGFRITRSLAQSDSQAGDYFIQAQSLVNTSPGVDSAASAQRFFARALEIDPDFAEAWAGSCQALMEWYYYQPDPKKIQQAESSCLKALELDPDLGMGRVALGDLYRKTGSMELAIETYQSVLDMDNTSAAAWLGLGEAFAAQELDVDAESALNRAIVLDPDDLRAYYALGAYLFKHGRYEDAASVYNRLAQHPNADASAFNGQGVAYYMMGDFESAAEAYRLVIASSPTAAAYSNVGTQYYYNGQYEDAAVMYRQAIALGPTNPVWWGNLGDALQQMEQGGVAATEAYTNAAALAEDMLLANPDDAETLTNLAHYQSRLGNDEKAMAYVERARASAPHDFYTYYYAALVHMEAGRNDQALRAIQQAVELGYPIQLLQKDPQFSALESTEGFPGSTGGIRH